MQGMRIVRTTGSLLAIAFLLSAVGAASVSAEVVGPEAHSYADEFDVSLQEAEDTLETQGSANEVDLVAQLEARLGDRYAGVWFDNERGEFVIPLLPGANPAAARDELADADLVGKFRTVPARSSWRELEDAQRRLDEVFNSSTEQLILGTSLDARLNALLVNVSDDAKKSQTQPIQTAVSKLGVEVVVRPTSEEDRRMVPLGCIAPLSCGAPLRGGVQIEGAEVKGAIPPIPLCSVGFKAIGNTNGNRYVLTAGHCLNGPWPVWKAEHVTDQGVVSIKPIGTPAEFNTTSGDWGKINANGSFWDQTPWPTMVAYWGIEETRQITSESSSYMGQHVCHSGRTTGSSCGVVTEVDVAEKVADIFIFHSTIFEGENLCGAGGDSGGSVFAGNTAIGIISSGNEKPTCNQRLIYSEITEATDAMGVSVAPRTTHTTVSATALNGNPGWATVKGEVHAPGGVTINNKKVEIKLFKWENSTWVDKKTLEATVNNNEFEYKEWEGVGVGSWIAKAIFPAQAPFGASASNVVDEGAFTVKDGYQLESKNAPGKCLDVHNMGKDNGEWLQLWDCLNPAAYQNQVFTLVPQGEGKYQLRARHSGRCLDVLNGSPNDGAPLQQWTCGSQAQQKWSVHAAGGKFVELRVNHVNPAKCMDVANAAKTNGAPIQQWACNGGAQQKWELKSVDSDKIPTTTGINAPQGERLNGEPGYATVWGHVHTGAYGIGGNTLKVEYRWKNASGNYEWIKNVNPTLNSEGRYEVKYEGLKSGDWQIQAKWPGINNIAGSDSPTIDVHIGSGYRFKFRHSSKCMSLAQNNPQNANGVGIIQWDCAANPNPNDGQVFTLVPYENGTRFQIEINQTDKCVDVTGGSSANLAWYQQWSCSKPPVDWQLFGVVPISGQAPWNAFQAKHSGKCADVYNASKSNGERVLQYDCHWGINQQWEFQGIG